MWWYCLSLGIGHIYAIIKRSNIEYNVIQKQYENKIDCYKSCGDDKLNVNCRIKGVGSVTNRKHTHFNKLLAFDKTERNIEREWDSFNTKRCWRTIFFTL